MGLGGPWNRSGLLFSGNVVMMMMMMMMMRVAKMVTIVFRPGNNNGKNWV
jgi:hypothetical protein